MDSTENTKREEYNNIIFFDGVCNLCNKTVDFIITKDRKRIFRFASLQSSFAEGFLKDHNIQNTDQLKTIYFYRNRELFSKSGAIVNIHKQLDWPWKFLGIIGTYFPWFISDICYDFIARNRYKWMGKRPDCRLPTKEEKSQFIG